ncbi:MAG: PfkB family carbohydrate kinase [Bacteroidales bacterium]|nr:PfkB family carbohydrate kinase [Bacteroidales bacterium]
MNNTQRKVYGIGETIYDIIFKNGKPVTGHPGGSTFNCMISLGRCGVNGAFISETGRDQIGNVIVKFLQENNLSGRYVNQFKGGKSALALAFLDENNDAVYDFYKDYPNQRLEIELPVFNKNDILVFGSFFALNQAVRPIVKRLIEQANSAGAIIYYDPNYRSTHLPNRDDLITTLIENFKLSTIIRGSDEDFGHIYPGMALDVVYGEISQHCPNLICTANKSSVGIFTKHFKTQYPVPEIEPLSTIGAGDSFNAGFVYALIKNKVGIDDIPNLSEEIWADMVNTAITFSSEVCMSYENYVSWEFAKELSK